MQNRTSASTPLPNNQQVFNAYGSYQMLTAAPGQIITLTWPRTADPDGTVADGSDTLNVYYNPNATINAGTYMPIKLMHQMQVHCALHAPWAFHILWASNLIAAQHRAVPVCVLPPSMCRHLLPNLSLYSCTLSCPRQHVTCPVANCDGTAYDSASYGCLKLAATCGVVANFPNFGCKRVKTITTATE